MRRHDLGFRLRVVFHNKTIDRAFEVAAIQNSLREHVHGLTDALLGELLLREFQTLLPDEQVVIAQLLERVLDLAVHLLIQLLLASLLHFRVGRGALASCTLGEQYFLNFVFDGRVIALSGRMQILELETYVREGDAREHHLHLEGRALVKQVLRHHFLVLFEIQQMLTQVSP